MPPATKAEQLLDLNSSWDSTAQTSPGISSFAKDTSQILKPQSLTAVMEEEEEGGGVRKSRSPTPPKPKPRLRSTSLSPQRQELEPPANNQRYSVANLSALFDKGVSPAGTQGWSSAIQKPTSPSTTEQPTASTADYANLDEVIMEPVASSSPPALPTSAGAKEVKYEVVYGYQATDSTEITVVEGDVVTFVPREDASTGWLMVQLPGGTEGWVPESYLQPVAGEGVALESGGGVAKETGQVMPPEAVEGSPSCE